MALEYCDSFSTYTGAQSGRRYPANNLYIRSPGPGGAGYYAADGYAPMYVTPRSEYFIGFDFRSQDLSHVYAFLNIMTAAGAVICSFSNTSSIRTSFGDSALGTIVTGPWYQIQIYIKRHPSAGMLTVKVDGVVVIDLSGLNTGTVDIGLIQLIPSQYGAQELSAIANFWIFNTLGSHSNTWPIGRMKVAPLYPASDGTYNSWTPNSGSTHFDRVNSAQADDDTTYNSAITPGALDSQGITALPAGIAHIHGVQITAVVRKDDVDSKTLKVFTKSGPTETYSGDFDVPLDYTSITRNGIPALLHPDDPNTGAEWLTGGVNALEIGVKVII